MLFLLQLPIIGVDAQYGGVEFIGVVSDEVVAFLEGHQGLMEFALLVDDQLAVFDEDGGLYGELSEEICLAELVGCDCRVGV